MGTHYKTDGHTVHIVTHLELWILKIEGGTDSIFFLHFLEIRTFLLSLFLLNWCLLCEVDFSLYTFGVVWFSMNVCSLVFKYLPARSFFAFSRLDENYLVLLVQYFHRLGSSVGTVLRGHCLHLKVFLGRLAMYCFHFLLFIGYPIFLSSS